MECKYGILVNCDDRCELNGCWSYGERKNEPTRQLNIPQNAGSCEGCRYAQPVVTQTENIIVECYRYPATLLVLGEDLVQVHPDAVYRCGEYKPPREEQIAGLKELLEKLRAHPLTPAPED